MLLHYRPVFKAKALLRLSVDLRCSQFEEADQSREEHRSAAIVLNESQPRQDQPPFWLILHKVSLSGTLVRVLSHLSGHQDARRQNEGCPL